MAGGDARWREEEGAQYAHTLDMPAVVCGSSMHRQPAFLSRSLAAVPLQLLLAVWGVDPGLYGTFPVSTRLFAQLQTMTDIPQTDRQLPQRRHYSGAHQSSLTLGMVPADEERVVPHSLSRSRNAHDHLDQDMPATTTSSGGGKDALEGWMTVRCTIFPAICMQELCLHASSTSTVPHHGPLASTVLSGTARCACSTHLPTCIQTHTGSTRTISHCFSSRLWQIRYILPMLFMCFFSTHTHTHTHTHTLLRHSPTWLKQVVARMPPNPRAGSRYTPPPTIQLAPHLS